ncbi:hypothetical protein MHTCC0001_13760 [Flavobacteriaceae bacterium MHTCC 0001]
MKYIVSFFLVVTILVFFRGAPNKSLSRNFSKVQIRHIIEDSLMDVRALEIVPDKDACIFLTSRGQFGAISFAEYDTIAPEKPIVFYPINLNNDSTAYNFRSIGVTKHKGLGLTIGNPAYLVNIDVDKTPKAEVVYEEYHPQTFYDSIEFWNNQEGIAIGDPTNGCMSIIITRDGGDTWTKLPCSNLPKAEEGEAAFAASDTNIAIVGDHTWVATGGKASRVLYSPDKGKTWYVYDTPIIQGKETTGIYSIDFYDELNGFAIGGDYTKPEDNTTNKIRTSDGGKTWKVVAKNKNPGYRSCVRYVPKGKGKVLVALGFNGIDYSNDSGDTWKHLSDEGFYTIRFLNDTIAYAAGKGRVSKLIFR